MTCANENNSKEQNEKVKNYLVYSPILFPFNINMATNVAKTFLTLTDKHYPKDKIYKYII